MNNEVNIILPESGVTLVKSGLTKHLCDYCGGFELDRPGFEGVQNYTSLCLARNIKEFPDNHRRFCAFCHLKLVNAHISSALTPEMADEIMGRSHGSI